MKTVRLICIEGNIGPRTVTKGKEYEGTPSSCTGRPGYVITNDYGHEGWFMARRFVELYSESTSPTSMTA